MNGKPLVLVVDDETHIRHVVGLKLRSAGYGVVTAEDGEEGLTAAIEHRPHVIISDYHMPYMTGLELCLSLKQHPATRDTPVIMVTSRGFNLRQDYLAKTSVTDVISKPFSPREILARIEALLAEHPRADPSSVASP